MMFIYASFPRTPYAHIYHPPPPRHLAACPHITIAQQNVRAALADANKVLSSSAPDAEKEEARIEVEVFEGLQAALAK